MKRYMTNGAHVRELREQRERRATQKEFAHEVRISERHLRQIERRNAEVPFDVIQRIAEPKRDSSKMQMQAIIAFGPPGEYGEESVQVPIDHGQPWIYDPAARLF